MIKLTSHGKTILTGEHAVIRGAPAIVIPNLHQSLSIHFDETKPFKVICQNEVTAKIFEAHFPNLWQIGQDYLGKKTNAPQGELVIQNHVPIARGCGFSAAFSVIVAKLLHHFYDLETNIENIFKLSLHFETQFHGNSSGADIAGAMSTKPIWFKNHDMRVINCQHQGYFYIFDSGQISHTKKCVEKVTLMADPKIDLDMALASGLVLKGLENKYYSLELISQGIQLANECFEKWGLVTPEVKKIQEEIAALGGITSKVTGAGGGGYVLGYFKEPLLVNDKDHCEHLKIKE